MSSLSDLLNDFGKSWIAKGRSVPEHQIYKLLEWRRLREILIVLRINCVLDVGAARGQFAINLRKIGYQGKIVSFEPVSEAFEQMGAAFATNSLWQGFRYALGGRTGEVNFHVATDSTEMSSVLVPKDDAWQLRTEVVPMKTLDSILDKVLSDIEEPRIFLKMDTQGYDVEVIKGAANSMDRIMALQSELVIQPDYIGAPLYLEALTLYQGYGFRPVSLIEAARDLHSGIITEVNCVLVRGDGS